jgi:hypothetical protein
MIEECVLQAGGALGGHCSSFRLFLSVLVLVRPHPLARGLSLEKWQFLREVISSAIILQHIAFASQVQQKYEVPGAIC